MTEITHSAEQRLSPGVQHLIAVRTYELWENHGRPHGCDLIHWRQAEEELLSYLLEVRVVQGQKSLD
jgi:hypothetical protein